METFCEHYPVQYETELDCISSALSCAFNLSGTLLAVGCNDGRVVIWDFATFLIRKILPAHMQPVTSLQWFQTGNQLVTSSTDSHVCKWNILSNVCEAKLKFPTPAMKVQINPTNENKLLVSPLNHVPVLINMTGGYDCLPMNWDDDLNVVALFDPNGRHIYTGNNNGRIAVFDVYTLECIGHFHIGYSNGKSTAVKTIVFGPYPDIVAVGTVDRCVRIFSTEKISSGRVESLDPILMFQDNFNKDPWSKICFSPSGDYICAGNTKHALCIWDISCGTLVKKLKPAKNETLLDMAWHPERPIIVSISSGILTIWTEPQCETWEDCDEEFQDIDENVVYIKEESEYDDDNDMPISFDIRLED